MAEEGDDSDKTEEPTQRRLEQAFEKGDVVKSQEVVAFFTLGAIVLTIAMASAPASRALFGPLRGLIEHADSIALDGGGLRRLWLAVGGAIGTAIAAPLLIMVIAGIAGHMVQHRLIFTAESLKPKLSKISPMAGLKRLFSPESLMNFGKGLVKIILVGSVMGFVVWPKRALLDGLITTDLAGLLGTVKALSLDMLGAILAIMFVIAALDYFWTRYRWMQRQRMSVQEIKEEYKQTEGDPTVKGKIKQIRAERSRKRMLAAVPQATVVVTNPTHYAVALKYDEASTGAPRVVAKGADLMALRIRDTAKGAAVPVLQAPVLARALYAHAELDREIPIALYSAVAQVLAYVYQLRAALAGRGRMPGELPELNVPPELDPHAARPTA